MSECKLVKLVLHFSLLTTDGVDPFTKNLKGETPLSLAAGNGHEDMVRLLLKVEGSDPDTKNFPGETPLCWAAGNGHETVVKLLLVTGVDPESKDSDGRTPLSSQLQWQSRSEPLL
ncbi:ankyrin repeat-containing domain protein [Aspergillus minisclerotigenes]|uniref:Ankyrin repeat-containing domain protein n=1 Tax=Aspergillus minisclerotigenes TaxID=656917 RepID=A0A5N6J8W0_9EURO|nr:ankyrin repeat-containing domain protein [Aspergillus minisclerotigenes]